MTEEERRELLVDEWLIVRNSGEIPEITFHSALFYLQEDEEGPGIELTDEEVDSLKEAALARYHEIIIRDISLENYHRSIYRGVRRTIYNWQRCQAFEERKSVSCDEFCETVVRALLLFLHDGVSAAGRTLPERFINCTVGELRKLAEDLQIKPGQLPHDIARFCLQI
ncbi:MAG: hypothetical protein K9K37_06620 [Desulfocapsa sp.]|nr:hypothetical protein [Desulfocapsa sp.]